MKKLVSTFFVFVGVVTLCTALVTHDGVRNFAQTLYGDLDANGNDITGAGDITVTNSFKIDNDVDVSYMSGTLNGTNGVYWTINGTNYWLLPPG